MADEGAPPTEETPGVEPTESVEPVEPTEPVEPIEPLEPVEPIEPEPPAQLSSDEIIDKAFQKTASWLGRRDQDLLQNIGDMIEQKTAKVNSEPISASPETMLDDPDQWFQSKYSQMQKRETEDQIEYNKTMFRSMGSIMDADPLFADKELGTEVMKEVEKLAPQVDRRLPADAAGNMIVKEALVNVYKKRTEKKINPLDKNKPIKEPIGGITPPVHVPPKGKAPKISPMASEMAKRWGYKEDDLKRVFGE